MQKEEKFTEGSKGKKFPNKDLDFKYNCFNHAAQIENFNLYPTTLIKN